MTLALIIICLMVVLVVVDGTETSGHESEVADAASPAEESDHSRPGGPCILSVKSILGRSPKGPHRQGLKHVRPAETETTPR